MNREDQSKVSEILGIHHITAIAGDPQRNIGFYTGPMVDKKEEELGQKLLLPKWLEPDRKYLEKILPKVKVPSLDQFSNLQDKGMTLREGKSLK